MQRLIFVLYNATWIAASKKQRNLMSQSGHATNRGQRLSYMFHNCYVLFTSTGSWSMGFSWACVWPTSFPGCHSWNLICSIPLFPPNCHTCTSQPGALEIISLMWKAVLCFICKVPQLIIGTCMSQKACLFKWLLQLPLPSCDHIEPCCRLVGRGWAEVEFVDEVKTSLMLQGQGRVT